MRDASNTSVRQRRMLLHAGLAALCLAMACTLGGCGASGTAASGAFARSATTFAKASPISPSLQLSAAPG